MRRSDRELTRRATLALGAGAVSALVVAPAAGQEVERHGMSAFGDLKYSPDFKQIGRAHV